MTKYPTVCSDCPVKTRSAFAEIGQAASQALDQIRSPHTFKAGEELPFKNQAPSPEAGFYCIHSGHLKLGSGPNAKDQNTIRVSGPGDLVGYAEPDRRSGAGPSYSGSALDTLTACFFEFKEFRQIQSSFAEISEGLVTMLCRIVQIKTERIIGLENHSVKNRVAALLLSLNSKFGVADPKGSRIDIKIDRRTLALLAGTVAQTLGRVLTELEDELIIIRQGKYICITHLQKLRMVAINGR